MQTTQAAKAVNDKMADADPFTLEDITCDPWAAVEKAIPGDATSSLLLHARDAATRCFDQTGLYLRYDYETPEEYDAALEQLKAAEARVVELDRMIEPNPQVSRNSTLVETPGQKAQTVWSGEPAGPVQGEPLGVVESTGQGQSR